MALHTLDSHLVAEYHGAESSLTNTRHAAARGTMQLSVARFDPAPTTDQGRMQGLRRRRSSAAPHGHKRQPVPVAVSGRRVHAVSQTTRRAVAGTSGDATERARAAECAGRGALVRPAARGRACTRVRGRRATPDERHERPRKSAEVDRRRRRRPARFARSASCASSTDAQARSACDVVRRHQRRNQRRSLQAS